LVCLAVFFFVLSGDFAYNVLKSVPMLSTQETLTAEDTESTEIEKDILFSVLSVSSVVR